VIAVLCGAALHRTARQFGDIYETGGEELPETLKEEEGIAAGE
jgi:hypothetical protein